MSAAVREPGRPWWARAGEPPPADGHTADHEDDDRTRIHGHTAEAAALCPVCTFARVAASRPDLVEHLSGAMRELALAARAVIDAYLEGTPARDDVPPRVQRIPVDE